MSCVHKGLRILFQTGTASLKYKQMEQNQNVALCVGNMQIEGIAKIKGHTLEEGNKEFVELYKERHPGPFERYSHMEEEVVIEVEPKLITLWKYNDSKPFRDFLHVSEVRAIRVVE